MLSYFVDFLWPHIIIFHNISYDFLYLQFCVIPVVSLRSLWNDNHNYSNLEICAEEGELDKVDVSPGAGLGGGVQHIAAVRPNGSGTFIFHL